jgi:ABC-type antimicrobial peptide transport system permease subunit
MLALTDRIETERTAVISQAMVDRYYAGVEPIGKQIRMSISFGFDVSSEPITIVGVVGDVRTYSVTEEPVPEVYLPQAQMGSTFLSVVVRGIGPASDLFPFIRSELRALDPNLPMRDAETLTQIMDREFGSARFHVTLLSVFAGVAVTLAAIGLYGVVAYLVSQRHREIGVRIALGAKRHDVVRLVLRQARYPVLTGLVVGIAGTLAASRVLNSLLYGVPARDPATLITATGVLSVVVVAAVLIPATRASRIAPLLALRND